MIKPSDASDRKNNRTQATLFISIIPSHLVAGFFIAYLLMATPAKNTRRWFYQRKNGLLLTAFLPANCLALAVKCCSMPFGVIATYPNNRLPVICFVLIYKAALCLLPRLATTRLPKASGAQIL